MRNDITKHEDVEWLLRRIALTGFLYAQVRQHEGPAEMREAAHNYEFMYDVATGVPPALNGGSFVTYMSRNIEGYNIISSRAVFLVSPMMSQRHTPD
jgi:hypothetical protein